MKEELAMDEAERHAADMAPFPNKDRWVVERIRIITEARYYDDAEARRQTRAVLAGLDLAEQRRRVS